MPRIEVPIAAKMSEITRIVVIDFPPTSYQRTHTMGCGFLESD
jgi:hypothetical protein